MIRCNCCNEKYTLFNKTSLRQPLILKCAHTFCEYCLTQKKEKYSNSKETNAVKFQINCPTCNEITLLHNGIKDLPLNVYLMSYIEINQHAKLDYFLGLDHFSDQTFNSNSLQTVEIIEHTDSVCKLCNATISTYKCLNCKSLLCFTCFRKIHAISAQMGQHKPIPIVTTKRPLKTLESVCKEHERPIEYFCQDDSASICSRCYIFGNHKNHSIISFEEKNKSILIDIENEMNSASIVLNNLKKIDKKVAEIVPGMKNDVKTFLDNISKSFLTLHALLQVRESELVNSVTKVLKENLLSLEEQKLSFSKETILLGEALKDAKNLIENSALLIDANALLVTLQNAKKIPCFLVKENEIDMDQLSWEETNYKELLQKINSFGEIKGRLPFKTHFCTLDEAPDINNDDADSVASAGSASNQSVREIVDGLNRPKHIDKILPSAVSEYLKKYKDFSQNSARSNVLAAKDRTNLAVKGVPQQVIVTHIKSPNDFYVQLQSSVFKLERLSFNINSWCIKAEKDKATKTATFTLAKNMLVLARYSADKMWYRAKVLEIEKSEDGQNTKITVLYIDFGNEEVITMKDLLNMEKRFLSCSALAVHCSLFDVAPYDASHWTMEAVQEFLALTQNKVFLLSVLENQGELYEVDLVFQPTENVPDDGFVSVRDILVFLQQARFKTFSTDVVSEIELSSYQKVNFIQPKAISSDKLVPTVVTFINSPWDFHVVILNSDQEYYDALSEQMQKFYSNDTSNIYSLHYPRAGNVCSVKAENNNWYRGKILHSSNKKKVTVQYVDTGAVEVVTYDHLKKLHCNFLKLPVQAVHCQLYGVCPMDGPSGNEADTWFQKTGLGLQCFIKIVKWQPCTEVILWLGNEHPQQNSINVNSQLISLQLAQQSVPNLAAPFKVKISPDYSPDFYQEVAKKNNSQKLQILPRKPTVEAAPSSQERNVKSETIPSNVHVDSSLVHKDISLNGLANFCIEGINSKKLNQQRKSIHKAESTVFNEDKKKFNNLEEESKALNRSESISRDTIDGCTQVVVSCYKSPSEFYVQRAQGIEALNELMRDIQVFYDGILADKNHQWKVNEFCVAKCFDGRLYRCVIKNVLSDLECEVFLVDYGNTCKVHSDCLHCLTKELGTKLECSSVRCHLAELHPAGSLDVTKWSHTAIEYMTQAIKKKKLYLKQDGELKDSSLPIDLIIEEEIPETAFDPISYIYYSLRQSILNQGLAMPVRSSTHTPNIPDLVLEKILFESDSGSDELDVTINLGIEDGPSLFPNMNETHKTESLMANEITAFSSMSHVVTCAKSEAILSSIRKSIPLSWNQIFTDSIKQDEVSLEQVPFPPLPPLGSELIVVPTHITDSGIIWAQSLAWAQDLIEIFEEFLNFYGVLDSKAEKKLAENWNVGDLCASPFEDDKLWYRVEIKNISSNKAEVFYIDYGNTAIVNLADLKKMNPSHLKKHRMCFCLKIHDITLFPKPIWELSTIKDIRMKLISAECKIVVREIDEPSNTIAADICLVKDGHDLKDDLIRQCVAVCNSDDRQIIALSQMIGSTFAAVRDSPQLQFGSVNSLFRALVTHVERPDVVYLQPAIVDSTSSLKNNISWNVHINSFVTLMEKLNTVSSQTLPAMVLKKGQLLEGNFTVDNRWYRAVLVKEYPLSNLSLVTYFDFGNSELLPPDRLRPMSPDALSCPIMTWRCHLPVVPPESSGGMWTRDIICGVNHFLLGKEVLVKIIATNPKTVLLMDVENNSDMLNEMVNLSLFKLSEAGVLSGRDDYDMLSSNDVCDVLSDNDECDVLFDNDECDVLSGNQEPGKPSAADQVEI